MFNQDGDLERCALRPGNVHSAHGWRDVLDPVVARYRGQNLQRLLRGDAAFALPDVYEYLEAEGFQFPDEESVSAHRPQAPHRHSEGVPIHRHAASEKVTLSSPLVSAPPRAHMGEQMRTT